jgi:hypothetical protein
MAKGRRIDVVGGVGSAEKVGKRNNLIGRKIK